MRSNSGLDFSNISAGFAGASNALAQGVDIKSRQALEEMKDARAENLARMNWTRDMLKQKDMLDRQQTLQESAQRYGESMETQRELAAIDRQQKGQQGYLDVLDTRSRAAAIAAKAEEDAREGRLRQGQIAQNRLEMERAKDQHLRDEASMRQEISRAVQARPDLSMIDDPVKLHTAMANDPSIGPMLDQMTAMQKQHADSITAYTLYGAQLGDPMFQGKQTAELDNTNPGGTPTLRPSGGGAATPNNPNVPANQLPTYPVNNPADDTPAVAAPPPGSEPGSSPAGMPPTAGPLTRPPVTKMVGPLRMPPQLIPAARTSALSSGAPMPGINIPAGGGAFPGIANPTGAPPSLIPQQGF
jgi:hypothetical protein